MTCDCGGYRSTDNHLHLMTWLCITKIASLLDSFRYKYAPSAILRQSWKAKMMGIWTDFVCSSYMKRPMNGLLNPCYSKQVKMCLPVCLPFLSPSTSVAFLVRYIKIWHISTIFVPFYDCKIVIWKVIFLI